MEGPRPTSPRVIHADAQRAAEQLIRHFSTSGPHPGAEKLLVACMPKSASSRLASMIAMHPEVTKVTLNGNNFNDEPQLDRAQLIVLNWTKQVSQHHVAFGATLPRLMHDYQVRVLVLVRNIFDVLVSAVEHIDRNNHFAHIAWIPANYCRFSHSQKLDFVIDHVAPFLIKFYVSWTHGLREHTHLGALVTYDDVIAKPAEVLNQAFGLLNVASDENLLKNIISHEDDKVRANFNVGIGGRGATLLSDYQRDRVKHIAQYYDSIDWEYVGLV
ncbi:MAG: sulfotransferase domain-containing protein [Gammaproteobacteria bacterium]